MDKKQPIKLEVEEYKGKYLRALADYQNLEKRVDGEKQELRKNVNAQLIFQLLSFLDDLDRAEVFIKDEHLKLIKDNFWKLLHNQGLEEIEVQGKEFDPNTAEVIDLVPGNKDNQVVEVTRKGYKFNGRVLRVAQVKVSKKN
jgi:molecular chaperone GrpE